MGCRSSPRTRGTRLLAARRAHAQRYSPAYAGNTAPHRGRAAARPVHPRIRGEHKNTRRSMPGSGGSSPHTRGTRFPTLSATRLERFIPAYAGNTSWPRPTSTSRPVHPRIRGEHGQRRGQACKQRRFIPAYAGNTVCCRTATAPTTVHPRIRGEHRPAGQAFALVGGSSPHTRGTRRRSWPASATARFIPAYAGNTTSTDWNETEKPVHPRIRGEHQITGTVYTNSSGSSPHTRGTRSRRALRSMPCRFIPAYAGNTRAWRARRASGSVHPRIRGEHGGAHEPPSVDRGSSPHTRGTLHGVRGGDRPPRFIPAYAGNTGAPPSGGLARPVHPRIRGEHTSAN